MMVMDRETSNMRSLCFVVGTEEKSAYHGMFNVGINPRLLCIYADLDRIVDTPAVDRKLCHITSVRSRLTS